MFGFNSINQINDLYSGPVLENVLEARSALHEMIEVTLPSQMLDVCQDYEQKMAQAKLINGIACGVLALGFAVTSYRALNHKKTHQALLFGCGAVVAATVGFFSAISS